MRFRLKHLFAFCAAISAILAISSWIASLDWEYSHVVSLECGDGKQIHIYEDFFCDFATIPVYEVTDKGKIVSPRNSTFLWFECGHAIHNRKFVLIWDDSKSVVAVMYDDELALVYDFRKQQGWPRANGQDEVPAAVMNRLDIPATEKIPNT